MKIIKRTLGAILITSLSLTALNAGDIYNTDSNNGNVSQKEYKLDTKTARDSFYKGIISGFKNHKVDKNNVFYVEDIVKKGDDTVVIEGKLNKELIIKMIQKIREKNHNTEKVTKIPENYTKVIGKKIENEMLSKICLIKDIEIIDNYGIKLLVQLDYNDGTHIKTFPINKNTCDKIKK